jgi:flavin-dependent dehydrogenase
MYDAIIIGAGIGGLAPYEVSLLSGLVCGCYLAKAGMKVLICEQHHPSVSPLAKGGIKGGLWGVLYLL